jgi:hypothetical protein
MTEEKRSEINRKRRETYHRKKAESMLAKVSKGNTVYTMKSFEYNSRSLYNPNV